MFDTLIHSYVHSITRSNLQFMANYLIQIVVTLQLLMAHGEGVREIEVFKSSGQTFEILVPYFVAHCPMTNKWSQCMKNNMGNVCGTVSCTDIEL